MQENKQLQNKSRILQGEPRASRQAEFGRILQKYSTAQRETSVKNETGLPDNLKSGIENTSGVSLEEVRVHYNSSAPADLNALAYAQGTDIHVAPGQEQHLPHEAWHVVQQMQGRVSPTMQMGGVNINDNESLEKEADVMGNKALQCKMPEGETLFSSGSPRVITSSVPVQLLRAVAHAPVNFTFDAAGIRTAPKVKGGTNPIGRSAWMNQVIGEGLIVPNGYANYVSGHQIAHRFGGADAGDNVAAWPDPVETAYSAEEDKIDSDPAFLAKRLNDTGTLTVSSSYQDAGKIVGEMADACYGAAQNKLDDMDNWHNLNPKGNLHPQNLTPQIIKNAIVRQENTQQYKVTDSHVAEGVDFSYQSAVNAAWQVKYQQNNIPTPDWKQDTAIWEDRCDNNLRAKEGNATFKFKK